MIYLDIFFSIEKSNNQITVRLQNRIGSGPPVKERYGRAITPEQRKVWNGRKWPCIAVTNEEDLDLINELGAFRKEILAIYQGLQIELYREPSPHEVYDTYVKRRLGQRTHVLELLKMYLKNHPKLRPQTRDHYAINCAACFRAYQTAKYNGEMTYAIDKVNLEWITNLEYFLHNDMPHGKCKDPNRKLARSSADKYMDKFVAIFNYAHEVGLLKVHPFPKFRRKFAMTAEARRVQRNKPDSMRKKITEAQLRLVERNPIPAKILADDPGMARIRLMFLFQRWTGMAYIDCVENGDIRTCLTKDMVGNDIVMYTRHKTGELAIIPYFEETREVVEALGFNVNPGDYQRYCNRLKQMFRIYEIPMERKAAHLGRHMFGAMMLRMGFSVEDVAAMMGNSPDECRETYAVTDSGKIHASLERIQAAKMKIA